MTIQGRVTVRPIIRARDTCACDVGDCRSAAGICDPETTLVKVEVCANVYRMVEVLLFATASDVDIDGKTANDVWVKICTSEDLVLDSVDAPTVVIEPGPEVELGAGLKELRPELELGVGLEV